MLEGMITGLKVARGEKRLERIQKELAENPATGVGMRLLYKAMLTPMADAAGQNIAYLYGAEVSTVTRRGTKRRTVWLERELGKREGPPFFGREYIGYNDEIAENTLRRLQEALPTAAITNETFTNGAYVFASQVVLNLERNSR